MRSIKTSMNRKAFVQMMTKKDNTNIFYMMMLAFCGHDMVESAICGTEEKVNHNFIHSMTYAQFRKLNRHHFQMYCHFILFSLDLRMLPKLQCCRTIVGLRDIAYVHINNRLKSMRMLYGNAHLNFIGCVCRFLFSRFQIHKTSVNLTTKRSELSSNRKTTFLCNWFLEQDLLMPIIKKKNRKQNESE